MLSGSGIIFSDEIEKVTLALLLTQIIIITVLLSLQKITRAKQISLRSVSYLINISITERARN